MSEEVPKKERPKLPDKVGCGCLGLFLLGLMGFLPLVFDLVGSFVLGWGFHIVRIQEEGGGRLEAAAAILMVVGVIGATVVHQGHGGQSSTSGSGWLVFALLAALGGGLAVAVVAHQAYWAGHHRVIGWSGSRAHAINCKGNLKQVGLALIIYAGDHDGWLPEGDDFGLLREQEYLTFGKVYQCPVAKRDHRLQEGELVDDFRYLGSGKRLWVSGVSAESSDSSFVADTVILAHEGMNNHRELQVVNCLLADGSARSIKVKSNESFLQAVKREGLTVARELD